jgi:hypothetical protein
MNTNQASFDLSGTAPVEVALLATNGSVLPVSWMNTTQWVGTVSLSRGDNVFKIEGYDISSNKLPAYGQETYTVTNTVTRN